MAVEHGLRQAHHHIAANAQHACLQAIKTHAAVTAIQAVLIAQIERGHSGRQRCRELINQVIAQIEGGQGRHGLSHDELRRIACEGIAAQVEGLELRQCRRIRDREGTREPTALQIDGRDTPLRVEGHAAPVVWLYQFRLDVPRCAVPLRAAEVVVEQAEGCQVSGVHVER